MWKHLFIALICVAPCCAALPTTSPTPIPTTTPAVNVEAEGVLDSRQWGLGAPAALVRMALVLGLNDDGITRMQGLPRVRLIEATDDLGDALHFHNAHPTRDPSGRVHVDIGLSQPLCRAKSIALLRGEVIFPVGGQLQTVTFDKLTSHLDKPLKDPVLARAGLHVTLTEQQLGLVPKAILIQVEGRRAGLTGARLSGGNGTFSRPMMRSLDANGRLTLFASTQIPNSMKLQMEVWWGGEEVTVPFEIRDVRLP